MCMRAAPYSTFTKDATQAPMAAKTSYDYIVVGGGTSGCALAATLSQGAKVLLLERGDLPYGIPSVNTINGFFETLANLGPTSASQTFVSEDGVVNQRARVLGGGSALNAGFYTRASGDFVSKAGWDSKLVKESYEWVEKKVAFEPKVLAWQEAVKEGLLEAGVLPNNGFTYEHIYGTKVGGSIFDRNGKRHTAANFLEYADPSNITIYLNATVHQLLFKTNGNNIKFYIYSSLYLRARGVLYEDVEGKKHVAVLNEGSLMNEVIVSAGTLGSPQLLMLSGIGPSKHLTDQGIKVLFDQPMVGQGLSDNPMNILLVPSHQPVEMSLIEVVGITRFGSFIETASSPINFTLLQNLGSKFGIFANPDTSLEKLKRILQHHHKLDLSGHNTGLILEKVTGPLSVGNLELVTKNPNDNPKVRFNYFEDSRDLQACVEGMETILKVLETKPLSKFRDPLLSVHDLLELYCKDTVLTIWHYHGGCQVDRVVDRNYRVIGVGGLRVVDSSTLLYSPGTNPQATMMMLGRYMGVKMLGERLKK
ncbi:hypothetical protein SSX86_002119 [Deinandra increscens subsp. villosa]|uniref:Glucose-methanol-choline oxidoreductase N-terminal domain-containing protein n=1 Tax=Deinandra increscens subsp. villosa TaxID=3103831 RepID=A0AAP0DST7_9ASTR